MFSLTSSAARQIMESARDAGAEQFVLRVAARREPDGSIDYGMGFDDVGTHDTRLLLEDVPVVIAPQHLDLLEETVLDFVETDPGEFNFIFVAQPDAPTGGGSAATGCGKKTGGSSGGCGSCGGGSASTSGGGGCSTRSTH